MENQFYQMYLDELSEIPECTNEEMEALLNSLPNEEAVMSYVRQQSMQEMMLKYQILFRKETWHFCLY